MYWSVAGGLAASVVVHIQGHNFLYFVSLNASHFAFSQSGSFVALDTKVKSGAFFCWFVLSCLSALLSVSLLL